ncbi:MAG: isoprenylcysteine carboxylmethyltransferase family protein [Chloroflexi bacterium]|jgi:protein-S-isoprenylcysteine O-methyltransferase Ste14|nr:isoprenylcysteine carboxylmethyltransferase family protein [Chloroflexota bacterium]
MNSELWIRAALALFLAAGLSVSITYRHLANRAGDQINEVSEEGRRIFLLRSFFALGGWGGALLYLVRPEWMAWAQISLPVWLRWAGVALTAACVPLIYWVFSSLGKNVTRTVAIRKEHTLVRHGPYRYIRHPLYATGFLLFLGFSLAAANLFLFLMMTGAFLVLDRRADLEEARLIERFGSEYVDYMKVTGRYLP